MIESFRDKALESFFRSGRVAKGIPADAAERVFRKLQLLDDATCDLDLRAPPSNRFEKLAGALAGWHSIRVNDFWRLVFVWDGSTGKARELRLDPHRYRG
ncbi:MAG: type II toxin-antitoxin system RelE/ParE family toxin [Azospirillum sp.]|nr:type II toxin-antitoxin system RelE/ParE family toxin [Azospirillum sp.]